MSTFEAKERGEVANRAAPVRELEPLCKWADGTAGSGRLNQPRRPEVACPLAGVERTFASYPLDVCL